MELNDTNIKAAPIGSTLRDGKITGLHLTVKPTTRAFYLYYRTKAGVERRPKLGDYGTITLAQARKVAQEMLAKVALGEDPSLQRQEAKLEATLEDLWKEYWKRHGSKKKSSSEDERIWNSYVKPKLGANTRLSHIDYVTVADLHEGMDDTPIQANRVLSLLSKMYNFAIAPLRWTKDNPCKGVKRFKEDKRKRYMKGDEPQRIATLLDKEKANAPASVAFIYLLILTGARSSEIAAAKWEWLDGNVLRMPDSKTGYRQVYLPEPAMEVIRALPVTKGTITGIKSPRKLWERVREKAGCPDLRLHDLRHSFASAAIAAGYTLAQIGELLGHSSAQTTQRYAHLVEEAAVSAATNTADRIVAAMKKTTLPASCSDTTPLQTDPKTP